MNYIHPSNCCIAAIIAGASISTPGSVAHAQNLLINPSFEQGIFVNNSVPGFMMLFPGMLNITGWTVISSDILWGVNGNVDGLTASQGIAFLDFSGIGIVPFGGVTQSIPTVPGMSYELAFDLGVFQGGDPLLAGPISVTASAGSVSQLFAHDPPGVGNQWDHYLIPFTAESSSTAITFQGETGVNYIGLDNVSVMIVPEPSTALLLPVSMAVLSLRRRTLRTCRRDA